MNREILFRGRSLSDGIWVFGDLEYERNKGSLGKVRIHTYKEDGSYDKQYLVESNSVGQFTGLSDSNGAKIFEGDIVKRFSVDSDSLMYYYCGVVLFDNNDASFKLSMFKQVFDGRNIGLFEGVDDIMCNFVTNVVYDGQTPQEDEYCYEVIGNIYDNPKLPSTK